MWILSYASREEIGSVIARAEDWECSCVEENYILPSKNATQIKGHIILSCEFNNGIIYILSS